MDAPQIINFITNTPYVSNILSWLLFGLSAGLTAKIILPGKENMSWLKTIAFGFLGAIAGTIGGHYLGYEVKMGWNLIGFIFSVGGAMVLILINKIVTKS